MKIETKSFNYIKKNKNSCLQNKIKTKSNIFVLRMRCNRKSAQLTERKSSESKIFVVAPKKSTIWQLQLFAH